ncbi:HNH endonuclease signature motif containing protein [Microbacterium sp. SLBN-146]|uniref:HNH endonuclease signature motif containing protein n=1 Tax=Microbacterium sp. SLBN-146 TaxID=2768457 RepID=UPI00114E078C|nr:HNH endonuclease signature motif containing protein [Microbacterium sp. SLBN-146]TQJ31180.1 uncharacterized protein DUF222 [Microbacterium sp. SLBN-146]
MSHNLTTDEGWTNALDDLVTGMIETRRQIAAFEARQERLLSEAVDLTIARTAQARAAGRRMTRGDLAIREVAAELGAAMRVSDRTVQSRMGDAASLTSRFQATLCAWEDGRISAAHARIILDIGAAISDDAVFAQFEATALGIAETEAPARLRALARAVAARLDPEETADRQRRALDDRLVRLIDLDDGLARIIADQPAPLAYAIFDRLTQLAREVRGASDAEPGLDDAEGAAAGAEDAGAGTTAECARGDAAEPAFVTGPTKLRQEGSDAGHDLGVPDSQSAIADTRTIDQLRADVFADLLLAGAPAAHGDGALGAVTGHVQVTVPVLTAAGVGTEPCLLAGYGPIETTLALRLAGKASGWDRVLTHPHTGAVLAVDRYRPDESLRRHLRARDEHCRMPGCRRSARRSDIDHTKDAAKGGPTSETNLAHFCRRHHTLKHHTAWRVRQRPGGIIEWISPTSRTYRDRPPSTVRFVPTDWHAVAVDNSDDMQNSRARAPF